MLKLHYKFIMFVTFGYKSYIIYAATTMVQIHTDRLKELVSARSLKLSSIELTKYLDELPLSNSNYCKQPKLCVPD